MTGCIGHIINLKQNGSRFTAVIKNENEEVILNEKFSKSEAVEKMYDYFDKYCVMFVEFTRKDKYFDEFTWTTFEYDGLLQTSMFLRSVKGLFGIKK